MNFIFLFCKGIFFFLVNIICERIFCKGMENGSVKFIIIFCVWYVRVGENVFFWLLILRFIWFCLF